MKKTIPLFFSLFLLFSFSLQAQFVVKEAEFEWFPHTMKSDRCAIEAIVPKADGSVQINTFTQTLAAVMIQSGVFAGSANGYKLYPLMNTKVFDAELKPKANVDDYYNYRMFLPRDKWEKNLFMMLHERMSQTITIPEDSNFLPDMIRKYPAAVQALGEGRTVYQTWFNDPPEDTENKIIRISANEYYAYDQRSNSYKERSLPSVFINPIIAKRTDGKRMESMELLKSNDYSVLQRYAFFGPSTEEDKWAIYKHRIIVTYDGKGEKTNETMVDMEFPRKEVFAAEVRNAEDNTTNGFVYVYHRVFGMGKKYQDSVLGNHELVYLDAQGNKKFQYIFKINDKANSFNPFTCYAKNGKLYFLYFGHPDGKTMAVTTAVFNETGVESLQSMLLGEWKGLISGKGVSLVGWADDGFLLYDVLQDKNGYVYLIGEKRTQSTVPAPPAQNGMPSGVPKKIHVYPSHIVLVLDPDGKAVRQHVIQKPEMEMALYDRNYTFMQNDHGVFMVYKDMVAPAVLKPFQTLVASDLSEVQRNAEPTEYAVSIIGLNGSQLKEFYSPFNLYHSQKGLAIDGQQGQVYVLCVNPANGLPHLFKVSLW